MHANTVIRTHQKHCREIGLLQNGQNIATTSHSRTDSQQLSDCTLEPLGDAVGQLRPTYWKNALPNTSRTDLDEHRRNQIPGEFRTEPEQIAHGARDSEQSPSEPERLVRDTFAPPGSADDSKLVRQSASFMQLDHSLDGISFGIYFLVSRRPVYTGTADC